MILLRRGLASLIAIAAVLVSSVAVSGWLAERVLLDPARTAHAASAVLADPTVKQQLEDQLVYILRMNAPASVPTSALQTAARDAVASPAFLPVFAQGVADTQRAMLDGNHTPVLINITPAARTALAGTPAAAWARSLKPRALSVHLAGNRLPDLSGAAGGIHRVAHDSLELALLLWAVAFVVSSRRGGVVRKAGYFLIGASAYAVLFGYGVPAIAHHFGGPGPALIAAFITASTAGIRTVAIVGAILGVGLVVAGVMLPTATKAVLGSATGARGAFQPQSPDRRFPEPRSPGPHPSAFREESPLKIP